MSRISLLALVTLVAACHEYPSGARQCEAVPLDGRCAAFADAEVDRSLRCGTIVAADAEAWRIAYADWYCGGDRPADAELEGLLGAGRIVYDEREAGCVIRRLRELPCDASAAEREGLVAWLGAPLEPATAPGEPCTDTVQCIDSYCPARVCGRTCLPYPAIGELCGEETPCAPGTTCEGGRCARSPGLGEVCERGCASPFLCLGTGGGGPNRCFAYVEPGAVCDTYRICRTECVDVRAGAGVCAPEPVAGDACHDSNPCAAGLVCDRTSRTCVAALHPGDPCDPAEGWRCLLYAFYVCDGETRRCVARPGIGEACRKGECRLGVCLDGICGWPPPETMTRCTSDRSCGDDRICESGLCVDGCR